MIKLQRKVLTVAFVILGVTSGPVIAPLQPCFANKEHQIAVVEESINNKPHQVVTAVVKARPEQVWHILTDFNAAPRIFSSLKKCQVLVDKGTTKIVHHQVKPSGLMTTFQYDLELKEVNQKQLSWHRVGGDFKAVEGFWKLEPTEGGRATLVTYATYVNGGMFMPLPLIKRQSRIDMPQVMAALKNHAENTVQVATHAGQTTN